MSRDRGMHVSGTDSDEQRPAVSVVWGEGPWNDIGAALCSIELSGEMGMKILAVADENAAYFYDFYTPGKLDGFDMILSAGDLSREYLEFLVTMAHCPVFYVPGNHDECFAEHPPEGCICVDGQVAEYKGVRILGLGGSFRYREGTYMYTEEQMRFRIARAWPSIFRHHGFDILLTHAPARHINDMESLSHRGFECFCTLIDRYRPKFFVHGHVHRNYGLHIPQRCEYHGVTVINAWKYCIFELPETGK